MLAFLELDQPANFELDISQAAYERVAIDADQIAAGLIEDRGQAQGSVSSVASGRVNCWIGQETPPS